jgi:hypothetical protein
VAGHEARLDELHRGLARAEAIVAERSAALESLQGAIEALQRDMRTEIDHLREENRKLHEGLAHAESLAFSREKELQRIRDSWAGRIYSALRRGSTG